jgi:hypothetical protein
MAKPDTKTVTRIISIPKIKVIKQPVQQPSKSTANDAVRTAIKPTAPQKSLSNQQSSYSALVKDSLMHGFQLYLILFDVINDRHSETRKRC